MKRRNFSSGARWENLVGYSRAVRVGSFIEVSGTVAIDGDQPIGHNNPYEQTTFILNKIKDALEALDGALENVVRTRIYVVNIDDWEAIGRAHGEFFKTIKPVTTMIEVSRLIDPEHLIEIEASAIVHSE